MDQITVAVVDDEENIRNNFIKILKTYGNERNINFIISAFDDGVKFLTEYKHCDVVFLDIRMSSINGIRTASKFRELDSTALLVFVTSFPQYAIKAYEFSAFDYILKPVSYASVIPKLDRICASIFVNRVKDIVVPLPKGGIYTCSIDRITYIEVSGHKLLYHLIGETIEARGSLGELESKLAESGFSRCNSCFLVNLKYVDYLQSFTVCVRGEELAVSRSRRKEFSSDLTKWLLKGGK